MVRPKGVFMRLGFVGTGVITKAVVTGLCRAALPFDRIGLSPRTSAIAEELSELDARVVICADNQDVLDTSDVVCVAVLPQVVAEVLGGLRFDPRHQVISFVAATPLADLRALVSPAAGLSRAIPLPAVADGVGVTAICPPHEEAALLFSALGEAVEVTDELQFDALSAVTATMASFFAVLEAQAAWLTRQGLPYDAAREFLARYSLGLANETIQTDRSFPEMINQMTPGGLNLQLHAELTAQGCYDLYGPALDQVLARVRGTSGSDQT